MFNLKFEVMKTQFKYQIAALTLMLGLGLSSFSAEAQRNEAHRGNKKEYNYNKQKRDFKCDYGDYFSSNDYHRNNRNKHAYNSGKHSCNMYDNRVSDHRYYQNERYAYHHPKYGNVYRHFYSDPVRLRHAHGDIYYHSGNYYNYYPHVGYVRFEMPRGYVFASLPIGAERFYSGGHLYYRTGDLVFENCANGYRLAPHFNVTFSARF